jgi:putative aldouronate transport system permease protein
MLPSAQPPPLSPGKRFFRRLLREKYLYMMMIPGFIIYLLFCYWPMYGVVIAFKDFQPLKGIMGSPWAGMKYFNMFFGGAFFQRTLRNTVVLSLLNLVWTFPIPIIFALMLNELRDGPFKRVSQTISYLPHFISIVVVVGIMNNLFSPTGLVTVLLQRFMDKPPNFLSDAKWFRTMYIGSEIWQHFGWNSIIYLAALSGIDPSLYEAAHIDGASRFRRILNVTIPGISSTIIILLILACGNILSVGFEKIILMYSPATYATADVISTYSYRIGILQSQYSFGAAVGLFNSVANCIMLVLVNAIARRFSETSLF